MTNAFTWSLTTSAERNVANANFVYFGGSTGIGRAAAIELGRRGASVLIVGRGREAGEAAAGAVKAAGASSADFLAGDLSTVAGITAVAEGVRAWRPELHGVMHTAMAAFTGKQITADGFEFAFALQYFARAALNRLLVDRLAASGDGRIVHIAGDAPAFFMPDLDDLQFERRKWTFFKAVLGTHLLGFLHIQEAAKRWAQTAGHHFGYLCKFDQNQGHVGPGYAACHENYWSLRHEPGGFRHQLRAASHRGGGTRCEWRRLAQSQTLQPRPAFPRCG